MKLRPLHPDFGVEVLEFDTAQGGTPEQVQALRDAFDEHQMLLFRGGERLTPERQIEISGWFGPPVCNSMQPNGPLWSVLRNDDGEDGGGTRPLPFHCDLSYTDTPIKGLSLHPIALPSNPTSTSYISNQTAWKTLSADRQALLADKTLRHVHASGAPNWPTFVADHPVRLLHSRTQRPILFVTEHHATRISELDQSISDKMLQELFAHLYAPQRVYEHQWRLHDLLIWDNLSIQHARRKRAAPEDGDRAMQRVALSEIGLATLAERAREREKTQGRPHV